MAEKKVAIYAQGSNLEQIDAQVRACRRYCEARNFAVALVNKDLTEKKLADRFSTLRANYLAREISAIVIVTPSRIARDKTQIRLILQEMYNAGIKLYCVDAEGEDIQYGYRIDETGRLIIAPEEAATIVSLYNHFAS